MKHMNMLLLAITFFFLSLGTSSAVDTIFLYQNITDGDTIVSRREKFELGFFSPGSSKNRYLGIWFKNTSPRTPVWLANRETPLVNVLGMVKLDSQGILSLVKDGGTVIWSSNASSASSTSVSPMARLLDTGNLVIEVKNSVIWQSFDYPGDTYIPGMKLGKDLVTGHEMYLTSWRSSDDPALGEYTSRLLMAKGKYPQWYHRKGSVIETRIGPYDGIEFAGHPNSRHDSNHMYTTGIVFNEKEIYYTVTANSPTFFLFRAVMSPSGKYEVWQLNMHSREWMHDLTLPMDYCDNYGVCGPYGSCSTATFPNCECLTGFEPKNPGELSQYSGGCRWVRALDCGLAEGFLKFSNLKLPDTENALFNSSMSLQECEVACKGNCSCTAYANPNATENGVGCLLWFGDLIDIRVYSLNGQDLYVRLAASELLGNMASKRLNKKNGVLTVVIPTSSAAALLFAVVYACKKKKGMPHMKGKGTWYGLHKKNTSVQVEDVKELPFFSLNEIVKATDNFSISNKIGEGGFGPVYKVHGHKPTIMYGWHNQHSS